MSNISTLSVLTENPRMGEILSLKIEKKWENVTHDLYYGVGVGTARLIARDVDDRLDWQIPDLSEEAGDADTLTLELICITYVGGNSYLGTHRVTVTVRLPGPASLEVPETVTLGSPAQLNIRSRPKGCRVRLTLTVAGSQWVLMEGEADGFLWDPEYAIAAAFPDRVETGGVLSCETFRNGESLGSCAATCTLRVPENGDTRPRFFFSDLTLTPTGAPAGFEGLFLRGITGLRGDFSPQTPYSRVESCRLTLGSREATGNPAVLSPLVGDGQIHVTGTVRDSRGFETAVTRTVTVLPYSRPGILPPPGEETVCLRRCDETGNETGTGTSLRLRAGTAFSSILSGGREKNGCALDIRIAAPGGDFGPWQEILPMTNAAAQADRVLPGAVPGVSQSYRCQLRATDALGSSYILPVTVPTAGVSFGLYDGEDGAAFGKYPEEAHVVDIAAHMTLRVRGELDRPGQKWVDLGLSSAAAAPSRSVGQYPGCAWLKTDRTVTLAAACDVQLGKDPVILCRDPVPQNLRPLRRISALVPLWGMGRAVVWLDPDGWLKAHTEFALMEADASGATPAPGTLDAVLQYRLP